MEAHPDVDWNQLIGRRVRLHRNGCFVRAGYVEDVTHAADALWLQGHGAEPRALYLKADGITATTVGEAAGDNG
jgi:hypothetical protein